jgi:MFS family permease
LNLLLIGEDRSYLFPYLPSMMVTGVGVGLTISTLGSSSSAFLPPAKMAMGSAVNTTVRQVGAALGIAVSSALLSEGATRSTLSGYRWSWMMIAGVSLLSALVMGAMYRRPTEAQRTAAAGSAPRSATTAGVSAH